MTATVPKVLNLEQAADALGFTVQQLRWLRSQGKGPRGARIGGRVFFREGDLADWVNEKFADSDAPDRDHTPADEAPRAATRA